MYYNTRMIQILQDAALKGGEVLRSYFRKSFTKIHKSTHHNIVTQADIESQKMIQDFIIKSVSEKKGIKKEEIGFIGEEKLRISGKYTFVIDPLDGTSNFVSGIDFFGVSIALYIESKLEYGVIYQPVQDIMYYAINGKGSYKISNKKAQNLKVLDLDLKSTYFNGGLSANDNVRSIQLKIYDKLFHHFLGHIALNAAAPLLCLVADNSLGLFISGDGETSHVGISIWDIAAGKLILEEAGGSLTDWKGNKLKIDLMNPEKKYSLIACHPDNLQKILGFMK